MSGDIPPPPPPPPPGPLPSSSVPTKLVRQTTFVTEINDAATIQATFLGRLKDYIQRQEGGKIVVSVNKEVHPVIQDGPCCGLVAAIMAASTIGVTLTFDHILSTAKDHGFTRQGEMFSAGNMKVLVEELIESADVTTINMTEDKDVLVKRLLRGDMCLIPYDSDFNFEPCNKRGHKAHWALLSGIGLVMDPSKCDLTQLVSEVGCVYQLGSDIILDDLIKETEEILVYGLQGKSQYPGVWSLSSLVVSNTNLIEVDPQRLDDDEIGYEIPPEGIEKALCGKALVLSPKKLQDVL